MRYRCGILCLLVAFAMLPACMSFSMSSPQAGAVEEKPAQHPDELFAVMLRSQGQEYITARSEMLQGGPAATEFLKSKLNDADWHVRVLAEAALDRATRPADYDRFTVILQTDVQLSFRSRGSPFSWLARALFEHPYRIRREDIGSLDTGLFNPAAVPFLLEVLIKGPISCPRPVPPPGMAETWTEEQQKSWSEQVDRDCDTYVKLTRCYAALELGWINDPRAIDALIEAATAGAFPELRRFGALGLAKTKRPEAIKTLLSLSEDPNADFRVTAVLMLGHVLDMRHERLETLALRDPEPRVREAAQWALQEIEARTREQARSEGQ